MEQLQQLAQHAWAHRIKSSSLKRNALLKPFDMILTQLEEEPRPELRSTVRAALVEDIFAHLERIANPGFKPGRTKHEAVEQYVGSFFDGVLTDAHHGDVNRLLGRARLLRSAYLFYIRRCIPAKHQELALREDEADVAEEAIDDERVDLPAHAERQG